MIHKAKMHFAGIAAVALMGAGCGIDDVQLNGKIFEATGLTSTGSVPKKVPNMAARSALIVPPSLDKLPEPGSGADANPAAGVADVQDHDEKHKISRADLEKQQAEYCKVHYTDAKIRGDQDYDGASGPLGPCRGSAFTAIKNWNNEGDK